MSLLREALEELAGRKEGGLPPHLWERALLGPAQEFLRRPGKCFRARLVELSFSLAGGAPCAFPPRLPLVIEVLHAGSLIVDDIEDGSRERRGAPALHELYGTALALNVGNWMYFWALNLLEEIDREGRWQEEAHRQARRALLRCHYGQALDLGVRVTGLAREEIPAVVRAATTLKTGSLVGLAATLGALAADAPPEQVRALSSFGSALGVGIQMLDDLGGFLSPRREEKAREDLLHGRPTWPWAWLAESAPPDLFMELQVAGQRVIRGEAPQALLDGLRRAIGEHGKVAAEHHLQRALSLLQKRFPEHQALDTLRLEIERLMKSYV